MSEREDLIRYFAGEMRRLVEERNRANNAIRDLNGRIKKETGIARDDFTAAMRLQKLATENREKTVANIAEVLRALGTLLPVPQSNEKAVIAPPGPIPFKVGELPSVPQPHKKTTRERLRKAVCEEPGTAKEIAERLNVRTAHVSAELSALKKLGRISHTGRIWGPP